MYKKIYPAIYGFVAFNILWYLAAVLLNTRALVNPLDLYGQLFTILGDNMWGHIFASLRRISMGIAISLILGVPLGLLLATNRRVDKVCSPLLYLTYPIPKLAMLPVVILLLGIGEAAKLTMIVLILIFQIIVAVRDAVRNIPAEDFHFMISLGARRGAILRWVMLPAILPEILTSLRIAVGTAVSVLFFTETFGTDMGMGFYIVDSWMRLAYMEMYAGILMLSLLGFVLFILIDIADHYLCSWKRQPNIA